MVIPERHSGKEFLGIYDSESLVRVGDLRQLMLTVAFSSSCDRGPMPLLEPLRQMDSSSRLETFGEFDSKSTGAHLNSTACWCTPRSERRLALSRDRLPCWALNTCHGLRMVDTWQSVVMTAQSVFSSRKAGNQSLS